MGHPKLKSIFNKEYLLGSSLGNDANGEDDQVEDQENGYRIGILEGEEKVRRRRTDCLHVHGSTSIIIPGKTRPSSSRVETGK